MQKDFCILNLYRSAIPGSSNIFGYSKLVFDMISNDLDQSVEMNVWNRKCKVRFDELDPHLAR